MGSTEPFTPHPSGKPSPRRLGLETAFGVCILHTMNSAELIRRMEKAGWVLRGVRGSHHVYTHPNIGGHISVPHPRKDLGPGLTHKLMKQAGLR